METIRAIQSDSDILITISKHLLNNIEQIVEEEEKEEGNEIDIFYDEYELKKITFGRRTISITYKGPKGEIHQTIRYNELDKTH